MGTISDKLEYLNETKQDIKNVMNYAGAGIESSTAFRIYPEKLYNSYTDILNKGVDNLFDSMPKRTDIESGSNLTINGTVETSMKITLAPSELEQASTIGKQLFNKNNVTNNKYVDSDGNIQSTQGWSISNYIDLNPNTTYTSSNLADGGSGSYIGLYNVSKEFVRSILITANQNLTFTTSANEYYVILSIRNTVINKTQLELGSTATNYEPYTGGIASPNPDYPQDIHTISGDNEIKVGNINIWDEQWEIGRLESSGLLANISSRRTTTYIPVNPNKTYYQQSPTSAYEGRIAYYTKEKELISYSAAGVRSSTKTFTTPENCYYTRICFGESYGTVYNNDICINLSNDNFNGNYYLHQEQSLSLNLPVENLLDYNTFENGGIDESGTSVAANGNIRTNTYIQVLSKKQYCFSVNQGVRALRIYEYDSDYNFISPRTVSGTNESLCLITTKENTKYLKLVVFNSNLTSNLISEYEPQLETGTKRNSYTPFGTPALEYSKIGDYEDEFVIPSGKNLAFTGWAEDFVNRINDTSKAKVETYDNRNCLVFSANAGYDDYENKYLFKIDFKENTQYTFTMDMMNTSSQNTTITILYTDGSSTNVTASVNNFAKKIFVSSENKTIKYLHVAYYGGTRYIDLDTFMVYEGTGDIPYEPYNDGKWYLKKNINKTIINSNNVNNIVVDYNNTNYRIPYATLSKSTLGWKSGWTAHVALLDRYREIVYTSELDNNTFSSTYGQSSLLIFNNDFTNLTTARDLLLGVEIYIRRASPQYILLNDILQQQLNNIYGYLKSYNEQTNITQENNDLPFIITPTIIKKYETTINE